MSRMEQVIGRGIRNCGHAGLPQDQQNCTVYLHICRYSDSTQETFDEYVYREFVEKKARMISKVKKVLMESAIDCRQQLSANELPEDWKNLIVTQRRAEGNTVVKMPLYKLSSPTFEDGVSALVCYPGHPPAEDLEVRPLSMYYDIKDDIVHTLVDLFREKPIWKLEDLEKHPSILVNKSVFDFILQDAITNRVEVKDSFGRAGYLESHNGLVAFTPSHALQNATLAERTLPDKPEQREVLTGTEEEQEESESEEEQEFPAGLSEDATEYSRLVASCKETCKDPQEP
jgi:hypothetical protein